MVLQTIEAIYDGQVIRPDLPLQLEPNTRIRITVRTVKPVRAQRNSFLATARSLKLKGPTDLAENLDDYLYGGKSIDVA
ncbi:MAG: antitoxin family protein [Chloroflexi bacterium]|nr:antitoxin family protein [Chloroflexota bacterium]